MAKNNVFQGPLPRGATKKEELVFRKTGITVNTVIPSSSKSPTSSITLRKRKGVRSRKQLEKELRKLKRRKTGIIIKSVDPIKFGMGLRAKQKQTLMKIIESQASVSSKERAKQMLAKLQ